MEFAFDATAEYVISVIAADRSGIEKIKDRAKKILLSVESDFRTKRAAYKSINAVKTKEEYASVVEALPFCKDIKLRFTETL